MYLFSGLHDKWYSLIKLIIGFEELILDKEKGKPSKFQKRKC